MVCQIKERTQAESDYQQGAEEDVRGVTGDWRKIHSEEFRGLYTSSNIIPVTKSWMMRKFGRCIKHGGEEKCAQDFGSGTSRKKTAGKI